MLRAYLTWVGKFFKEGGVIFSKLLKNICPCYFNTHKWRVNKEMTWPYIDSGTEDTSVSRRSSEFESDSPYSRVPNKHAGMLIYSASKNPVRHAYCGRHAANEGDGQGTEWTKYRMDRVQIFLYKVQNGRRTDLGVFSQIGSQSFLNFYFFTGWIGRFTANPALHQSRHLNSRPPSTIIFDLSVFTFLTKFHY